jgi:uncharacterized protein (TIGR02452 family)
MGERLGRQTLKLIAQSSLDAIEKGSYTHSEETHDLEKGVQYSKQNTRYYAADSFLSFWNSPPSLQQGQSQPTAHSTEISLLEMSTLDGARLLASPPFSGETKIGILNFASAKRPGGGFLSGAQSQEESIARSSTLYPTLLTATAEQFYTLHKRNLQNGFYSHAMVYSPDVILFRDDTGGWMKPLKVDVLTSPAVNAGVVRRNNADNTSVEDDIEKIMRDRMGRILFLFESKGIANIVLGSFGTGVFKNNVSMVARLWADLLVVDGARFKNRFERVVFAILGRQTFDQFKDTFEKGRV